MTSEFSPQDRIAVLAALMTAAKPAEFSRVAFFLGAGAPRGAGLPLADELKDSVAKDVFRSKVPNKIRKGRLEDVMGLFKLTAGKNGYELVAQKIRRYSSQPLSYRLLADLINHKFVEAVLTTNFDLLLDHLPAVVPVRLTILSSDEEHAAKDVPHHSTLVSKLHGSASDPSTMRGSWTDGETLPEAKAHVLRKRLANFPTVFVGWAALDRDILAVLRQFAGMPSKPRIFWVNPRPSPTTPIREVVDWFDSGQNYIALTADDFFEALHDQLFPTRRSEGEMTEFQLIAERIGRSAYAADLESLKRAKEEREAYRHRVHRTVLNFLGDLKNALAPGQEPWVVGSLTFNVEDIDEGEWKEEVERLGRGRRESVHSGFQIRTGGPALTMFIGNHYREDGNQIELTALLAYHGRSKRGTGTPLPPLTVWGASKFTVEWGSEASFKAMETWLEEHVKGILLERLTRFDDVVAGRAEGSKAEISD